MEEPGQVGFSNVPDDRLVKYGKNQNARKDELKNTCHKRTFPIDIPILLGFVKGHIVDAAELFTEKFGDVVFDESVNDAGVYFGNFDGTLRANEFKKNIDVK